MKYVLLGLSLVCLGFTFVSHVQLNDDNIPQEIAAPQEVASPDNENTGPVAKTTGVSDVVTKALAFKAMLTSTQISTLELTYTTTLARKWSNLPCGTSCRNGIQLGTNLTAAQYLAAMDIVKAALGPGVNNGADEFHQMNMAEAYLHANGGGSGYDSVLRWMAFLGTPSATGAWMLQFGGHHYAANIAFNNGHVVGATPFFMGLEPKTFTYNSVAYDPLGDERTALSNMLASLSSSQLVTAKLTQTFSDCVMVPGESNGGATSFPAMAQGQAASSLTTAQQNLIMTAIQQYVGDMDTATANNVIAAYASEVSQAYIAYTGSGTAGSASSFLVVQGDYVRIAGPHVWIEFSCQGGVVIQGQIHYHTIWRDRAHDYGVDLSGAPIDVPGGTGITTIKTIGSLNIHPNPAENQMNVTLKADVSNADVILLNVATGQKITIATHRSGNSFNYDVSKLPAGMYVLRIEDAANIYTGKFTKL